MVCFFNWFFAAAFCLPPLSLLLPNPNPVLQKIVLTLVLLPLLLALIVQLVHCFCFEYPHLLLLLLLHHSRTRERECCLLVLNSVTSTPQWIRQPEAAWGNVGGYTALRPSPTAQHPAPPSPPSQHPVLILILFSSNPLPTKATATR